MNPNCRFILCSATEPADTKAFYARRFPDATKIELDQEFLIPETIKLATRHCPRGDAEKNAWVKEVVENVEGMERMIIFTKDQKDVDYLKEQLEDGGNGLKVSAIHGGMGGFEQDDALRKFKAQESVVLVSSAVIGRGVDLEGVTHVVLYQPPTKQSTKPDYVSFVHKIGRCGRAGSPGTAVILTSTDQDIENLGLIVKHYKTDIVTLSDGAEDAAEELADEKTMNRA